MPRLINDATAYCPANFRLLLYDFRVTPAPGVMLVCPAPNSAISTVEPIGNATTLFGGTVTAFAPAALISTTELGSVAASV